MDHRHQKPAAIAAAGRRDLAPGPGCLQHLPNRKDTAAKFIEFPFEREVCTERQTSPIRLTYQLPAS